MKAILLFLFLVIRLVAFSQVPPVSSPSKAGCFSSSGAFYDCGESWSDTYNGVAYNCRCDCSSLNAQDCFPVSGGSSGSHVNVPTLSSENDLKVMVTGMILQSLFNSIMNSAQQSQAEQQAAQQAELQKIAEEQAKQQKIKDSIELTKYQKMMDQSKQLEGMQLNSSDYMYKTLDSEMEDLRAGAQSEFDGVNTVDAMIDQLAEGTDFFGSLPDKEVDYLFDPKKDPVVSDLDSAVSLLSDTAKVINLKKDDPTYKKEQLPAEECKDIAEKYQRDVMMKDRYLAGMKTTQQEIDYWEQQNSEAMMNAFLDGLNFATGLYLKQLEAEREPAELLKKAMQEVLKKEPSNTAAKNLIAFLDEHYLKSNAAQLVIQGYQHGNDLKDYYETSKDAFKNALDGMAQTNTQLMQMMKDPQIAGWLNDDAFMNACVKVGVDGILNTFLSSEKVANAFGKVFSNKIPYVAIAQLAVNEAYNATQAWLSKKQLIDLNHLQGNELVNAQNLQSKILSNELKLKNGCPASYLQH